MTTADDGNRSPKTGLFSPVSMSRVSQVIVDRVKLLIRDGELTPGTACRASVISASSSG